MIKNVKTSILLATAAVALPLTFRADTAKSACSTGSSAACAAKAAHCETAVGACSKGKAAATQAKTTLKPGYLQATYQVEGMTCAACETKLAKTLAKIEGVENVSACAKSKVAKLAFDPKKVKDAQLVAAIEKAGYQVKGETLHLAVNGMTCAACEKKVGTALAGLKGVKEQKVCHKSNQAIVTFDPKQISGDKVVAAISETGFTVVR